MVDEFVFINLIFDGLNVIMEWFLDGKDYCIINYIGFGEWSVILNLLIIKGGLINVMVIVFNSIYRKFVSVEMYVLYRINGILFSVFNLLIDIF